MAKTTLIPTSMLKDFQLFTSHVGSLIPSYRKEPPAGTLRISVPNTEVSKTEWAALYEAIGGEDGSTSDTFVLPYKEKEGDLEYYLVGKVIYTDIVNTGRVISQVFTSEDFDNKCCFLFKHGIGHLHPIIQIRNADGTLYNDYSIINEVGQSRIFMDNSIIQDEWTILAVG